MNHIPSIIWLISWPVLIYVTYKASVFALKLLDKEIGKSGEENDE